MDTDKVKIAIFDMALPLPERIAQKIVYPSVTAAARMFGYNVNQFVDRIGNHSVKKYLYKDGKQYAVRRVK